MNTRRLDEEKSLAGFGDKEPNSPFEGAANGMMSWVAELAVYYAAVSGAAPLTDDEWGLLQKNSIVSDGFDRAITASKNEENAGLEDGPMSMNLKRVRSIADEMKKIAASSLNKMKQHGVDIAKTDESEPSGGTDEVDVSLRGVDIHVKLNDKERVGGLQRAKISGGDYESMGLVSADAYYRAIEMIVNKYILDESTADAKYRDKIVDVQDEQTGATRTFLGLTTSAASNILLGTTTVTAGDTTRAITVKKKKVDVPTFSVSFELSQQLQDYGIESPMEKRFVDLWRESKVSGDFVMFPDPIEAKPKRTGYGVRINPNVNNLKFFKDGHHMTIKPGGALHMANSGQDEWVFKHYMRSGIGIMAASKKGVDRASGSTDIINPQYQTAKDAYEQLFVDKHDEFLDELKTNGFIDALVPDVQRRLFGVTSGENVDRHIAYFKFESKPPKWKNIKLDAITYSFVPDLRAEPQPLGPNGTKPTHYYKLYGTGPLENEEIAKITFRHFASSHPPQIKMGDNADVLSKTVLVQDIKTGRIDVQQTLQQVGARAAARGDTGYISDITAHYERPENQSDHAAIVGKFMKDHDLDMRAPGEQDPREPVSSQDIHGWVNSNFSQMSSLVPRNDDPAQGASDDADAKTWLWAIIGTAMKRMNLLAQTAETELNTMVSERLIRNWIRKTLIFESRLK